MLADGIVEDLSVVSHAIELDLLRVQDELAHDDRLVLSQLASGKQEFLEKKKKKKRAHTQPTSSVSGVHGLAQHHRQNGFEHTW